jgi:hypothetical protein
MKTSFLSFLLAGISLFSLNKAQAQDAPEKHFDKSKYKSSYTFFWLPENSTKEHLDYGDRQIALTDSIMGIDVNRRDIAYNRYANPRGATKTDDIMATMSRLEEFETDIYNMTFRGHGGVQWKENRYARYPVQQTVMAKADDDLKDGKDTSIDLTATDVFETMSPYLAAVNHKYNKYEKLTIEDDNTVKMIYSSCHPLYALIGSGNLSPKNQILFQSDTVNIVTYQANLMLDGFAPRHFIEAALLHQNTADDSVTFWNHNPHVAFVTDEDGYQDDIEIEVFNDKGIMVKDTVSFGPNRVRVLDLHKEASRFWKTHNEKHVNKYMNEYAYLLEEEDMQKALEQWIATENEEQFEKLSDKAKRIAYVFTYRNAVDSKVALDNMPTAKAVYLNKLVDYKAPASSLTLKQ